jgi:hypothetical protein
MLILASGRDARAESSFFEDKTVRLVLGFSPGGISDLWGRAIARGMSQHIPGKPNIILQNMSGTRAQGRQGVEVCRSRPEQIESKLSLYSPRKETHEKNVSLVCFCALQPGVFSFDRCCAGEKT